jgi:hypothetical protein
MTVTLGSLTFQSLQAQPYGYSEVDTVAGLAPRRWNVEGLVRPADWLTLLGIFESWRNSRKADDDTLTTLAVGSTVSFSGTAAGKSWSNVACWFTAPPTGDAAGAYISVGFELIDATEALEALKREQERSVEAEDYEASINGTYTVGGVTLTLLENPDGYGWGPEGERTASGSMVLNGPIGVIRAKKLNGYTDEAGWSALQTWYEAIALTQPVTGEWYPIRPPEMSRRRVLVNGAMVTRCTIDLELWRVP